jgi:hypothetical protein
MSSKSRKLLHFEKIGNRSISVIIVLIMAFGFASLQAQVSVRDSSINIPSIDIIYSFQLPQSDLGDRFGFFHCIGGGFTFKHKSNLTFGLEGCYSFGDKVNEVTISNLLTENGFVINEDGEYAQMFLNHRGIQVFAKVGYIWSALSPNPNSGFRFNFGAGFWQHRIRVEDKANRTPQIAWPYQQGYDRMSNGLMLNQFVGYQLYSSSRLVNFYFGVEMNQGFTKNRRPYNYDERRKDNDARFDASFGFKVGWMIPLYKRAPQEFYYN